MYLATRNSQTLSDEAYCVGWVVVAEAEGCIASRLEEDVELLNEEAVVRIAV
jgi:hypothetical protein